MKKLKLIPLLALVFLLNVASMCSNDDNSNSSADPTPVINTVTSGTWRITFYEDNGVDETTNYSNYNFTFNSNGVLTAANTTSYNGTWSVIADNSADDNPDNDFDFNISFTTPAPISFTDDLTDDWEIVSYTATKIELIDVSGGNGGTDYLTFEKN
ncbi:hypothetical protein FBBAL38_02075 [Flavobacteria bacterium BAL38]|nr:hypothetical protein FBBAL38_02075 [Flavobacteria bacterium BAL38]